MAKSPCFENNSFSMSLNEYPPSNQLQQFAQTSSFENNGNDYLPLNENNRLPSAKRSRTPSFENDDDGNDHLFISLDEQNYDWGTRKMYSPAPKRRIQSSALKMYTKPSSADTSFTATTTSSTPKVCSQPPATTSSTPEVCSQPPAATTSSTPEVCSQPPASHTSARRVFKTIASWGLSNNVKTSIVQCSNGTLLIHVREFSPANRPSMNGVTLCANSFTQFAEKFTSFRFGDPSSSFVVDNTLLVLADGDRVYLQNMNKSEVFCKSSFRLKAFHICLNFEECLQLRDLLSEMSDVLINIV